MRVRACDSLLALCLVAGACGDPTAATLETVTAETDELVYARPARVRLTVENDSDVRLEFDSDCTAIVERRVGDEWKPVNLWPPLDEGVYCIGFNHSFPAGETFHPVYEFGIDAAPGEYRVPFIYSDGERGLPVVSNVFVIK